ncbi:MAG: cob(I)yrinic acid a,c-diamide adenosyltransferase [Candidatus Micrarchaeia archaeon]
MQKGTVIIYHGDGEGKTMASIGHAVRALGHGAKVALVFFMKGRKEIGEYTQLKKLLGANVYLCGDKHFLKKTKFREAHRKKVAEGVRIAKTILEAQTHGLLVLDEILYAVKFGLLSEQELLSLVDMRGKTSLIITGREPSKELKKRAYVITKMVKEKHGYEKNHKTIEGLDF